MQLLEKLPLDHLTPSRLWAELDADTRTLAARSLYGRNWEDAPVRREADLAIAAALRFREVAVRRLSMEKRADYLARSVRPSDSLAHSLLLALHLEQRRELLRVFLDALGVPQKDGLIDPDHKLEPPVPEQLTAAVRRLQEGFPREHVDVYLASLLAMDPDCWAGLVDLIRQS